MKSALDSGVSSVRPGTTSCDKADEFSVSGFVQVDTLREMDYVFSSQVNRQRCTFQDV